MDTTAAASLGYRMGWVDAERYVKGTKADRRAIRRRLKKGADSSADFWGEYTHAIMSRLQAFAEAIREGRLPRTIKLTRIYYVINQGA
jgi:ubiquinone biosynthesis protein UbiJ